MCARTCPPSRSTPKPSTVAWPPVGTRRPHRMRMSVDLPEPFEPRRPKISPRGTGLAMALARRTRPQFARLEDLGDRLVRGDEVAGAEDHRLHGAGVRRGDVGLGALLHQRSQAALLLFDLGARRVDVLLARAALQHQELLGRGLRLRGGVVVELLGNDAVAPKDLLAVAFALVVRRDRGGLRDLLLARACQRLGEVRPGRFDGGALLVELAVDRRRLELHEELPGGDVLPLIDEDADDAAAGQRPYLDRAR